MIVNCGENLRKVAFEKIKTGKSTDNEKKHRRETKQKRIISEIDIPSGNKREKAGARERER